LYGTEKRRYEHLAKVKPESSRDVEVGIHVVDVMKAPE
jgi:hypothetical protein